MIRLFSIEDHWMVIDGLKARFRAYRDEISITCSAENIDEALTCNDNLFDIILLDLLIPGTDPVENVKRLQQQFPEKPIVILTSEERTVFVDQMCSSGVYAYLTKHDSRKTMKETIVKVAKGENCCLQHQLDFKQNKIITTAGNPEFILMAREKAILTFFSEGLRLNEIAVKMNMTDSAVGKDMARLRKQFNVKSNAALVGIYNSKPKF